MSTFDAARAEAIEVMAERFYAGHAGGAWRQGPVLSWKDATNITKNRYREGAATALEALLAARSSTTCETCSGTGEVDE